MQHLIFFDALFTGHEFMYVRDRPFDLNRNNSFSRWSINFFLFAADDLKSFDLNACLIHGMDDEGYLTRVFPSRNGLRHSFVAGQSLAVHFSYVHQRSFLETKTWTLERYRNLSLSLQHRLIQYHKHNETYLRQLQELFFYANNVTV